MELEIKGVSKSYFINGQKYWALESVNLTMNSGEFVCIVGPSGCGKSTLLNLIAGLDKPCKGTVCFDGSLVRGPGPDRALIFQDPALFPWLNVIENVEFGMKQAGVSKGKRRDRALQYLKMVHLDEFQNSPVHTLSGGMKQRASLARALALDSKMLLLDEPFAALDTQTRENLYQELQSIRKSTEKTILFITHQVEEAVMLADRILVMSSSPGRFVRGFVPEQKSLRKLSDPAVVQCMDEIKEFFRSEVSGGAAV